MSLLTEAPLSSQRAQGNKRLIVISLGHVLYILQHSERIKFFSRIREYFSVVSLE